MRGLAVLLLAGCAAGPAAPPQPSPTAAPHPLLARARRWDGSWQWNRRPCVHPPWDVVEVGDLFGRVQVSATCATNSRGGESLVLDPGVQTGNAHITTPLEVWLLPRATNSQFIEIARASSNMGDTPKAQIVLAAPIRPGQVSRALLDEVERSTRPHPLDLRVVAAGDVGGGGGRIEVEIVDVLPDPVADRVVSRITLDGSRMLFLGRLTAEQRASLPRRRCGEVEVGRCEALAADLLVVTGVCAVDLEPELLERVRPTAVIERPAQPCAISGEGVDRLAAMGVHVATAGGRTGCDHVRDVQLASPIGGAFSVSAAYESELRFDTYEDEEAEQVPTEGDE